MNYLLIICQLIYTLMTDINIFQDDNFYYPNKYIRTYQWDKCPSVEMKTEKQNNISHI